jgi:hypothetical protein
VLGVSIPVVYMCQWYILLLYICVRSIDVCCNLHLKINDKIYVYIKKVSTFRGIEMGPRASSA